MSAVVAIYETEEYPVYLIAERPDQWGAAHVEVDDETLSRWKRAIDEYDQVQGEMADAFDADVEARQARRDSIGRVLSGPRWATAQTGSGAQKWRDAIKRHIA